MLDSTLALIGGPDETTYNFVSIPNGSGPDGSTRIAKESPLTQPTKLMIKHSTSGKDSAAIDRHLISFTRVVPNGATTATYTCNLTFAIPRAVADLEEVEGLIQFLCSILMVPVPQRTPGLAARATSIMLGEA